MKRSKTPAKKTKPAASAKRVKRVVKKRELSPCLAAITPPIKVPEKSYFGVVEPRKIPKAAWEMFLEELAERGHVGDSAKAAGIKRITVYKHRDADPVFKTLMEKAHAIGMECLEDEAKRRAHQGVPRGVYYQGERVDTELEYSDRLLELLLSGRNSTYRKRQEITGAEGGPLMVMLSTMSDEELDAHVAAKAKELEEAKNAT